jgi:hypothetical protein
MIQFYIETTANDGTGDPLRAAFDGVNFNFTYTKWIKFKSTFT